MYQNAAAQLDKYAAAKNNTFNIVLPSITITLKRMIVVCDIGYYLSGR